MQTHLSIKGNILTANIFESIDGNVGGSLLVASDPDGVLERELSLAGQKRFEFEWGMPKEDGTIIQRKIKAIIQSCIPYDSSTPDKKVLKVSFVAQEVIRNENSTISRAYRNKTLREIIELLLFEISPQTKPQIELSSEDEQKTIELFVVSGFMSALDAIKLLLNRNATFQYDLFQRITNVGQQFVIQPTYSKLDLNLSYFLGQKLNMTGDGREVQDKYNVTNYKISNASSFDQYLSTGGIASRTVISSPHRKRFAHIDYNRMTDQTPTGNDAKGMVSGFFPLDLVPADSDVQPKPNNSIFLIPDQNSSESGFLTTEKKVFGLYGKNRISPSQMRNAIEIQMEVAGNAYLTPGGVVNIQYPSSVAGEFNKRLSGRWYILAIKHIVDIRNGYTCAVELARDTSSTPFGVFSATGDTVSDSLTPSLFVK